MALEGVQHILALLGALEFKGFSGVCHLLFVTLDDIACAALEQVHYLLRSGQIVLLADRPYAWAAAASYLEVQAGTVLAHEDALGIYLVLAGAQAVGLVEEVHQVARRQRRTVRPEIPPGALLHPAGDVNPGICVAGDAYPRIGLGILEEYVVLWLVLLNEVVFQQQGVSLGIYHGVLRVRYLGHKYAGFGVEPLRGHEVLRHPLVQVLCLAHIYDLALGVVVAVNSGGMREELYLFLYGHKKTGFRIH